MVERGSYCHAQLPTQGGGIKLNLGELSQRLSIPRLGKLLCNIHGSTRLGLRDVFNCNSRKYQTWTQRCIQLQLKEVPDLDSEMYSIATQGSTRLGLRDVFNCNSRKYQTWTQRCIQLQLKEVPDLDSEMYSIATQGSTRLGLRDVFNCN